MTRPHEVIRWLVAVGCVLAGFVVPLVVVELVVTWAAPDHAESDMALGLYAFFLGSIAGLLGMVVAAVLAARWLRGSLRHFGMWMALGGLAGPVLLGLAMSLAR